MRKLICLFVLFIGLLFQFCDCNFSNVPGFFDVKGIRITHLVKNGFTKEPLYSNAALKFQDYYGFQINLLVDYVSYNLHKEYRSFFSLPILNACSPPFPGTEGAKSEKIRSIQVITIFPYDSTHLAGSNINDIVYHHQEGILLDSFVQRYQDRLIPVPEIAFRLMQMPDPFIIREGYFQMKTIVVLSNNENYEFLSDSIRFID